MLNIDGLINTKIKVTNRGTFVTQGLVVGAYMRGDELIFILQDWQTSEVKKYGIASYTMTSIGFYSTPADDPEPKK